MEVEYLLKQLLTWYLLLEIKAYPPPLEFLVALTKKGGETEFFSLNEERFMEMRKEGDMLPMGVGVICKTLQRLFS